MLADLVQQVLWNLVSDFILQLLDICDYLEL